MEKKIIGIIRRTKVPYTGEVVVELLGATPEQKKKLVGSKARFRKREGVVTHARDIVKIQFVPVLPEDCLGKEIVILLN